MFSKMNCNSKSDRQKTPKTEMNKFYKQISRSVGDSPFRNLPNFSTPPSKFARIANPFEAHLFERLHLPMCSPNMFRQISTPKTDQKFKWTIEDISILKPADIDESTVSQHVVTEDPHVESMIQQKITTFFRENQVVPSPLKVKVEGICMLRGSLEVTPEKPIKSKSTRNSAAQTVLSLPPILPKELEDALKPYFNNTEDQQCTEYSINLGINDASLYKELFEFKDNEPNSSEVSLSPLAAISGECSIPAMLFSPTTRGFGSPPELKNCTISPITKTLPRKFSDISIDISMIVPSDNDNQPMSITCTPVMKTDTTFGKPMDSSMEYKQVSTSSSSSSMDSDKMDVSNSNTPHAKLFTGKKQRKRLSQSFRNKLQFDDENTSLQYEDTYLKKDNRLKNDTTDVGYCTHDTGDYSNIYCANVFASTPSKRNAMLDF